MPFFGRSRSSGSQASSSAAAASASASASADLDSSELAAGVGVGDIHSVSVDADGAARIEGYASKKSENAKMIGMSWKKRYFDISCGVLSYANSKKDLATGATCFAIAEVKLLDPVGDTEIRMRFPERDLTLKFEGMDRRNLWYKVLKSEAKRLGARPIINTGRIDNAQNDIASGVADRLALPDSPVKTVTAGVEGFSLNDIRPSDGVAAVRPPSPRSLLANPNKAATMVADVDPEDDYDDDLGIGGEDDDFTKQSHEPPYVSQPPVFRRSNGAGPALAAPPPVSAPPSVSLPDYLKQPAPAAPKPKERQPFQAVAPPPQELLGQTKLKVQVVDAKAHNWGDGDLLDNTNPEADNNFLDENFDD